MAQNPAPQGQQFWLLKLPNFVVEEWRKNRGADGIVGSIDMDMSKVSSTGVPQSILRLPVGPDNKEVPEQCDIVPRPSQTAMRIFVERKIEEPPVPLTKKKEEKEKPAKPTAEYLLTGSVTLAADVRPPKNSQYENVLKNRMIKVTTKTRTLQRMEESKTLAATAGTVHSQNASHKRRVAAEMRKPVRAATSTMTRRELQHAILDLFDKKQYYSIAEIMAATAQPRNPVRNALEELCIHHRSGPHIHMFQLKEEYLTSKDADIAAGVPAAGDGVKQEVKREDGGDNDAGQYTMLKRVKTEPIPEF